MFLLLCFVVTELDRIAENVKSSQFLITKPPFTHMATGVVMACTGVGSLCTVIAAHLYFAHMRWLYALLCLMAIAELVKAAISSAVFYGNKQAKEAKTEAEKRRKYFLLVLLLMLTLSAIFGIKFFQFLSIRLLFAHFGLVGPLGIGLSLFAMFVVSSFHLFRGYMDVYRFVGGKKYGLAAALSIGSVSIIGESVLLAMFLHLHRQWAWTLTVPLVAVLMICRLCRRLLLDIYLYGSENQKAWIRSKIPQSNSGKLGMGIALGVLILFDLGASSYLWSSQIHLMVQQSAWSSALTIVLPVFAAILCVLRSMNSGYTTIHSLISPPSHSSAASASMRQLKAVVASAPSPTASPGGSGAPGARGKC